MKKEMRKQEIGTMDFHGSVDITDPCYNKDVWYRMNDVRIKEGEYTCAVWHYTDRGTIGGKPYVDRCVGVIGIYLDGIIPPRDSMKEIGSIGVDAGVAGFFHNKPDYSEDEWNRFCDRMAKGDAWITDDGFFSCSGYGDGGYDVFACKQNDEIIALEIRFI